MYVCVYPRRADAAKPRSRAGAAPKSSDSLMVISHLCNLRARGEGHPLVELSLSPPLTLPRPPLLILLLVLPLFVLYPSAHTLFRASLAARESSWGMHPEYHGGGRISDHLFREAVLTRRPNRATPGGGDGGGGGLFHRRAVELIVIASDDKKCPPLFHRPVGGERSERANEQATLRRSRRPQKTPR